MKPFSMPTDTAGATAMPAGLPTIDYWRVDMSDFDFKPPSNTRLEYVPVTIGDVKLMSTRAMAARLHKQRANMPQWLRQFHNEVQIAAPVDVEAANGTEDKAR